MEELCLDDIGSRSAIGAWGHAKERLPCIRSVSSSLISAGSRL